MMKFKIVEYGDHDGEFFEDYYIDGNFVDRVVSGERGEVYDAEAEGARLMFETICKHLGGNLTVEQKEEEEENDA